MLRALSQGSCYRVGLVLLPGFSIMSLASVITPLNSANRISGRQLYHWTTLSLADEKVIVCGWHAVSRRYATGNRC